MSFPAYPRYKNSGFDWLGHIPDGWTIKPLWALFRRHKLTGYPDEQLLSVYRDYGVIPKASRDDNFNKPSDDLGAYQLVQVGDLAINKMKAWQGSVGISRYKGIVSPAYHVYAPSHSEAPEYLHHLFRCNEYIAGYLANSKGIRVNQWDLEPQQHSRMSVLLPPLQEQTQIARFLDHETTRIDALIEEQQRLIELLKEKRQAVISHAVTKGLDPTVPMKDSGVEWLGEVPAHWDVIRLGQNIRTRKGFAFSAADFSDEGAAVVKASDIKNHSINEPSTFIGFEFLKKTPNAILKKGNLVLSTVGSTPDVKNSAVGQIGCVPQHLDGALLNQNTVIFEPTDSRFSSEYLFFALLTTAYRDHLDLNAHGTANQASLSLSEMLSFCIPLPDLDEQKAISSELSKVLENVKALERESESLIGLLTERRSALISAVVTGKIDVRGWQPPASNPTPELVQEAV